MSNVNVWCWSIDLGARSWSWSRDTGVDVLVLNASLNNETGKADLFYTIFANSYRLWNFVVLSYATYHDAVQNGTLWWTLIYGFELSPWPRPFQVEPTSQMRRLDVIWFKGYCPDTHKHPPDCSNWTTKVVGKRIPFRLWMHIIRHELLGAHVVMCFGCLSSFCAKVVGATSSEGILDPTALIWVKDRRWFDLWCSFSVGLSEDIEASSVARCSGWSSWIGKEGAGIWATASPHSRRSSKYKGLIVSQNPSPICYSLNVGGDATLRRGRIRK